MADQTEAMHVSGNPHFQWKGQEVAIDQNFSYGRGQFLYGGIPRYSSNKLHQLFFMPQHVTEAEARDRWARLAADALTYEFIVAQLRHCDLDFPQFASYSERANILRTAVTQKLCRGVPSKVRFIEGILRINQISNSTLGGHPVVMTMGLREQ